MYKATFYDALSSFVKLQQLLLCEVSVPKEFRPEISEPRSVFDMRLNEMSLCRWIPRVDFQIS